LLCIIWVGLGFGLGLDYVKVHFTAPFPNRAHLHIFSVLCIIWVGLGFGLGLVLDINLALTQTLTQPK